jgi:hypothetical protein
MSLDKSLVMTRSLVNIEMQTTADARETGRFLRGASDDFFGHQCEAPRMSASKHRHGAPSEKPLPKPKTAAELALIERMSWILKDLDCPMRELARRAHLPAESHIGTILRSGTAKLPTLLAIAAGAHVTEDWLILGRGEPRGPTERSARYPELVQEVGKAESVIFPTVALALEPQSEQRFFAENRPLTKDGVKQWLADLGRLRRPRVTR